MTNNGIFPDKTKTTTTTTIRDQPEDGVYPVESSVYVGGIDVFCFFVYFTTQYFSNNNYNYISIDFNVILVDYKLL